VGQICWMMCLRDMDHDGRIMAKEVWSNKVLLEEMAGVIERDVGTGVWWIFAMGHLLKVKDDKGIPCSGPCRERDIASRMWWKRSLYSSPADR
jgi:hypothetical protein